MSGLDIPVLKRSGHGGSISDLSGAPRIAVVFERSGAGAAALREAGEMAATARQLTVVTLAPQARSLRRGGGEGPFNIAVRREAAVELDEAREQLGTLADRASFELLVGCPRPPLAEWVQHNEIAIILLPHRRMTLGGNPFAKILRQRTSAEVRIVK